MDEQKTTSRRLKIKPPTEHRAFLDRIYRLLAREGYEISLVEIDWLWRQRFKDRRTIFESYDLVKTADDFLRQVADLVEIDGQNLND